MIFVYFDKNGIVKEIINDNSTRVGNSNSDRIYFHFENEIRFDGVYCILQRPDESLSNEVSIIENREKRDIPYSKNRDLKYFENYKEYNFYYYELTSDDTKEDGLCLATIRSVIGQQTYAKGLVTFNIQKNVIKEDNNITQSQFDYLLKFVSSFLTKTEADNRYVNVEGDDTIKGVLYTEANTPYLIGKKGMVGLRAYMPNTTTMAGQYAVSYWKDNNGNPTDKDGNILYDDEGNIETDSRKFHYLINVVMTDENGNHHSLRLDKTGLYHKVGNDLRRLMEKVNVTRNSSDIVKDVIYYALTHREETPFIWNNYIVTIYELGTSDTIQVHLLDTGNGDLISSQTFTSIPSASQTITYSRKHYISAEAVDETYLTKSQANLNFAKINYVDNKVADLIGSAPETLNTLQELSKALGDNENFASDVAQHIGENRADIDVMEEKVSVLENSVGNTKGMIIGEQLVMTNVSIEGETLIVNGVRIEDGVMYINE